MNTQAHKTTGRFQWALNHYLALVFLLTIIVALNVGGWLLQTRIHLSSTGHRELASRTIALISSLPQEVQLTVFSAPRRYSAAGFVQEDLLKLLDELKFYSHGRIQTRVIHSFLDKAEADRLAARYKLNPGDDVVIVESGDRWKLVRFDDMVEVEGMLLPEQGIYMQVFQDGKVEPPVLQAFYGEERLASAIQDLVFGTKPKVYFLVGHGQPVPVDEGPEGLSIVAQMIERQNYEVKMLDLTLEPIIPEDAAVIIICGPKTPVPADQIAQLRSFVSNDTPSPSGTGRGLILMLDPGTRTGLEDFFRPEGAIFRDDVVLRLTPVLGGSRLSDTTAGVPNLQHPVISWIKRSRSHLVLGPTRTLAWAESAGGASPLSPFLNTVGQVAWGESDLETWRADGQATFDPASDTPGPLILGVATTHGFHARSAALPQTSPRLLGLGSARFLQNDRIHPLAADFLVNAVQWIAGRDSSLGISPKTPQVHRIQFSTREEVKSLLLIAVFGLIPALALIGAGILTWRRRA